MAGQRILLRMSDLSASPAYDERGLAPAYSDLRRTKSSLPVRIARRLTGKDFDYESHEPPRPSRRKQRRAERAAQRELDECNAYQRKQFAEQISRQLEERQQNGRNTAARTPKKRSITIRIKNRVLRRANSTPAAQVNPSTSVAQPACESGSSPQQKDMHAYMAEDFQHKHQPQPWLYNPDSLEILPCTTSVQSSFEVAELDGTTAECSKSRELRSSSRAADIAEPRTYPTPVRSPSPCLSSLPQRGRTISEIPPASSSKQMQCDSCHDAIKMTGYHYACEDCSGGDCLYCAKCVNGGRTCRHELHERTRNINRHPSNPQHHERRVLAQDRDSVISSDAHIELSAAHPHVVLPPLRTTSSKSKRDKSTGKAPHIDTPPSPVEMIKELEAKRREQDVLFREKEVFLREREAMLREREVLTATRERDAAFLSQWQAATILQQRSEVGAQFSPVSPSRSYRHSSFRSASRSSSSSSKPDFAGFVQRSVSPVSAQHRTGDDLLTGSEYVQRRQSRVMPDIARVEASMSSMSIGARPSDLGQARPRQISVKRATDTLQYGNSFKQTTCEPVSDSSIRCSTAPSQVLAQPLKPALKATASPFKLTSPASLAEDAHIHSHATSGKRKGNAQTAKTTSSAGSSQRSNRSKKSSSRKSSDRYEDDAENDEEGTSPPKRQKCEQDSEEPRKLFACPYYKHDPQRYAEGNTGELHYRGCAGGLFRDVPRVKQHLKRVHHRPNHYCRRCFEEFGSDEELQTHSSMTQSCSAKYCPFPEKIDEAKQAKIHVKRPGKDPQELWFEIYSIIFPDAPLPDSPYIEQTQPSATPPDVIDTFIDLFNSRLDMHEASQPWLGAPHVRSWLTSQLFETAQLLQSFRVEGTTTNTGSPSESIANLSERNRSKRDSFSRRKSASSSEVASPVSHRPVLKLRTGQSASLDRSPIHSADVAFPNLPLHVHEDPGYGNEGSASWMSGDDFNHMTVPVVHQEPASATSTRSTKSVSFATPSSHEVEDQTCWPEEGQNFPYALSDFMNTNWSAGAFSHSDGHTEPRSSPQKALRRQDSAYGTLSSAQNSNTSLFAQSRKATNEPACVDPTQLFRNDAGNFFRADLQTYLNRDVTGRW